MISKVVYHINKNRTRFLFKKAGVVFRGFITAGVPFVIIKNGTIELGDNLRLNNGMSANQIGFGSTPCSFVACGGKIQVGDSVGLSQCTLYALDANITIGNNTLIGGGTKIYTSDFHPLNYEYRRDRMLNEKYRISKDVIVGADCFLGAGTIILKGVVIGDRTVIGAGSVVTKSIPSDCIAAGNPCVVIKRLSELNK